MTPEERAELVAGYLRYLEATIRPDGRDHQDEWDALTTLLTNDPHEAWAILLELASVAPLEARFILGTGAVESFVFWNAPAFVEQIEQAIRDDAAFRTVFEWADADGIPKGLFERFRAAMLESGAAYHHVWTWVDEEVHEGG